MSHNGVPLMKNPPCQTMLSPAQSRMSSPALTSPESSRVDGQWVRVGALWWRAACCRTVQLFKLAMMIRKLLWKERHAYLLLFCNVTSLVYKCGGRKQRHGRCTQIEFVRKNRLNEKTLEHMKEVIYSFSNSTLLHYNAIRMRSFSHYNDK